MAARSSYCGREVKEKDKVWKGGKQRQRQRERVRERQRERKSEREKEREREREGGRERECQREREREHFEGKIRGIICCLIDERLLIVKKKN